MLPSTHAERPFITTNMPHRSAKAKPQAEAPGLQQQKYDEASRFLWFHYSPAQVADWYNARHTVDDLLDFDRHGMANAEVLGCKCDH